MRVAIVHYHLAPGGVTRVIETASRALGAAGIRHAILTGKNVEGLGYLSSPGDPDAGDLTIRLRAAATEALGGPPDVWHFHNHSLGKNALIPHVISRLAEENEKIVLQLHDLAEHGRATSYPLIAGIRDLYPYSPRIGYAFLNSRDLGLFVAAGLPAGNATLLANPIPPCRSLPSTIPSENAPLLFAPVRGIRRKNLGEMVLFAALAPTGARIAVSRAPENPAALAIHENWRKFALKHGLPIGFGAVDHFSPAPGAATDFDSWVRHASHFISTSVEEGFGMTFLEAIALGKPLVGRKLQHLATDHFRNGIVTGRLYDSIVIPIEWVDVALLRDHLVLDLERDHRFYQRPLPADFIDDTLDGLIHDGMIDFGNLSEPLQQGIIERLADPAQRSIPLAVTGETIRPLIDWLASTLAERVPTATPDQLVPYSPDTYQTSVTALYSRLIQAPPSPVRHVPPDEILTRHLRPENYHFLLTSPRPDTAPKRRFRAVIFDVYGTLLIAPPGGAKPDPLTDPVLREVLRQFGHSPSASPSADLHAAVLRHHALADSPFPEIDLRELWRDILSAGEDADMTSLVIAIEEAWHPAKPMPGAENFIQRLARSGISLGLLSNAQCNTLGALGPIADLFAPELTVLSYQHGIAKPDPELFTILSDRLAGRNISPEETLFIGNDPLHDIVPAAAAGFRTALFTGHPGSIRPGNCASDITFSKWQELHAHF